VSYDEGTDEEAQEQDAEEHEGQRDEEVEVEGEAFVEGKATPLCVFSCVRRPLELVNPLPHSSQT